jgi:hypothetical protein
MNRLARKTTVGSGEPWASGAPMAKECEKIAMASDAANFVTGTEIVIDSGYAAR